MMPRLLQILINLFLVTFAYTTCAQNVATTLGSNATLTCNEEQLNWDFQKIGANQGTQVNIVRPHRWNNASYYFSNLSDNASTLTILKARPEDAGSYYCFKGETYSNLLQHQVIVLGNLTCTVDNNHEEKEERKTISCQGYYWGNWRPVIACYNNYDGNDPNATQFIVGQNDTLSVNITIDRDINVPRTKTYTEEYECKLFFRPEERQAIAGGDSANISSNVPPFNYTIFFNVTWNATESEMTTEIKATLEATTPPDENETENGTQDDLSDATAVTAARKSSPVPPAPPGVEPSKSAALDFTTPSTASWLKDNLPILGVIVLAIMLVCVIVVFCIVHNLRLKRARLALLNETTATAGTTGYEKIQKGQHYEGLNLSGSANPSTNVRAAVLNTYDYPEEDDYEPYSSPDEYKRNTYCAIPDIDSTPASGGKVIDQSRPALPPLRLKKDGQDAEEKEHTDSETFGHEFIDQGYLHVPGTLSTTSAPTDDGTAVGDIFMGGTMLQNNNNAGKTTAGYETACTRDEGLNGSKQGYMPLRQAVAADPANDSKIITDKPSSSNRDVNGYEIPIGDGLYSGVKKPVRTSKDYLPVVADSNDLVKEGAFTHVDAQGYQIPVADTLSRGTYNENVRAHVGDSRSKKYLSVLADEVGPTE